MRRLLPPLLLLLTLALLVRPALAVDAAAVEEIRAAIAKGRTAKAVKQIERELSGTAPGAAAELQYLMFKAHVVDLGPDASAELYKQIAGKDKHGMEIYEAYLDSLEATVRDQGGPVVPVLVRMLEQGDRMDRLLVLGLLEEMAHADPGLIWGEPAGPGLGSPIAAALLAARTAAADCAVREQTLGIAAGAAAIEDQDQREFYVQEVFAAERGLEFLALVEPAAWGDAAAGALVCRGALGAVLDDRVRLDRNAAHLRSPLRELLESEQRYEVQVTALDLLGRYGGCEELPGIDALQGERIHASALAAGDRIRRRDDCD